MNLPLQPPIAPMLAKLQPDIPQGPGWLYEPKWDGFRAIVFRDGSELEIYSRAKRRDLLEQRLAGVGAATYELLANIHRLESTVLLTPQTGDATEARRWFDDFERIRLEGLVAKREDQTYQPGNRAMVKIKHHRTVDCVVGGYRKLSKGDGLGSLLLGLYDDAGVLH